VVKRLSDCDYRIKPVRGKNSASVVHFNRLKPRRPGTRIDHGSGSAHNGMMPSGAEDLSECLGSPRHTQVGRHLEIPDDEDDHVDPPEVEMDEGEPAPHPSESRYPTHTRSLTGTLILYLIE